MAPGVGALMVGINGDLVMGMLEGASAVVMMITVQVDTVAVDPVAVDRSVVGRLLGCRSVGPGQFGHALE